MAHGDDAEALTRIKAEFEGSSSHGAEVLYCRKDGGEFWTAAPLSFAWRIRLTFDYVNDLIAVRAKNDVLAAHKDEIVPRHSG